jgi:Protein of unknown function (DUF3038)
MMMPASIPKLDDLLLESQLNSSQLTKMTTELEAIAVAIAAITQIDRVEMEQVAQDLDLEEIVSEWLAGWSLDRPVAHGQFDVQQIRALVLMLAHIAHKYQARLRQQIIYWQQTIKADRVPIQSPALAAYISNFITIYQTRFGRDVSQSVTALSETALNLSIGLLFYSSPNGHQRLWAGLLQRSSGAIIPPTQFKLI